MQQQHGVVGAACGVAVEGAQGEIVEVELGDGLAVFEVEVSDVVSTVLSGPVGGGGLSLDYGGEKDEGEEETPDHVGSTVS